MKAVTRRRGFARQGVESRSDWFQAKVDWIEARQRDGRTVLYAGDGVNDGPAIARADLGVAMGSGAASSVLAADAVIASNALTPLAVELVGGRTALLVDVLWGVDPTDLPDGVRHWRL